MIRKLANPEANVDNYVKLLESQSGCCGTGATLCEYIFTDSSAITVRGLKITEDGVEVAYLLASISGGDVLIAEYDALSTDAERVKYLKRQILPFLLRAAGYINRGGVQHIQVSDDLMTITLTGEAIIAALVDDAPSDIAPETVKCKPAAICTYCGNIDGEVTDPVVSIDGDDYTVTGTFTDSGDVAAFATALSTALGANVLGSSVSWDAGNGNFHITIDDYTEKDVSINSIVMNCCEVTEGWKA